MGDTIRTPELADNIIAGISDGAPLRKLCRELPISKSEVYRWLEDDEAFAGRFAQARAQGFDAIADECIDIADDASNDTIETETGEMPNKEWIMRSKLRVETRLKLLSKWSPKTYGDKLEVEHAGGLSINVSSEDAGL